MLDSVRDTAGLDGGRHVSFAIVYRPDDRVGQPQLGGFTGVHTCDLYCGAITTSLCIQ